MNTHREWIELAHKQGLKSKVPAEIGCVIVSDSGDLLSAGWNHIPDGVDVTDARYTHPAIRVWAEHAERIAIYNAAKNGVCLNGATAYINYSPESICTRCIQALIQSGIVRFIGPNRQLNNKNTKNYHTVNQYMIAEANIEMITIDDDKQDTV